MYSDKSFYDLSSILISTDEGISISKLANLLLKSRRIVYYNIEKINIELNKNGINEIVNIPKKGIILNTEQKNILRNILGELEYILDKNERRLIIALLITTYPKRQTLNDYISIFKTSKNSILSDITHIKEEVKKFNNNLKIVYDSTKGYVLKGPELVQIQYVYRIIKEIISLKNYKLTVFVQKIFGNINKVFEDEFMELLVEKMETLQIKLGKTMSVKEINNFIFACPYLYIFSTKTKSKSIEKSLNMLQDRLEYKIISEIIVEFEKKYNTRIKKKIKLLFTLILLCTRKITDMHNFSKDYIDKTNKAKNLINNFEKESNYIIENKDKAVNELVTYLKVKHFRDMYNIVSVDLDYEKIKKEYKDILEILRKILKKENLNFTEYDEVNLCLYFSLFIKNHVCNILIISDEEELIKKNIIKKLLSNIANINIIDAIEKNRFFKYKNEKIDLIISTEIDFVSDIDTIIIDSFLSKLEINKIFQKINN
ncbi:BglG family transcription antiterminator [Oceanivirga salmonicida]|uniref:hypothetical protein n=2 Tax=Oceanivirga salmonicida TaxID=1769291 RepID=UPI0012E0C8C0|nr:hypothetical protein [Oceanivirga salmonicida]